MADQRVFSDEEFALILRKASELANQAQPAAAWSSGLTLTEMKAAAAQAGLDPALVERAARMVVTRTPASPFERLIGGPLRHTQETHLPIKLDQQSAAQLLSAVRIAAGQAGSRNAGHSSALGMTWHDGGELEVLSITARPAQDGTTVSVSVDRRGTLLFVGFVSGLVTVFVTLFTVFALHPEYPSLGAWPAVAGIGGVLALARGVWASSTKRVRERISDILATLDQTSTID
jgi:hypothetical protein